MFFIVFLYLQWKKGKGGHIDGFGESFYCLLEGKCEDPPFCPKTNVFLLHEIYLFKSHIISFPLTLYKQHWPTQMRSWLQKLGISPFIQRPSTYWKVTSSDVHGEEICIAHKARQRCLQSPRHHPSSLPVCQLWYCLFVYLLVLSFFSNVIFFSGWNAFFHAW